MHPSIYSSINALIDSFTHPFMHPSIYSFIHSFMHACIHLVMRPFVQSLMHPFILHASIHSSLFFIIITSTIVKHVFCCPGLIAIAGMIVFLFLNTETFPHSSSSCSHYPSSVSISLFCFNFCYAHVCDGHHHHHVVYFIYCW